MVFERARQQPLPRRPQRAGDAVALEAFERPALEAEAERPIAVDARAERFRQPAHGRPSPLGAKVRMTSLVTTLRSARKKKLLGTWRHHSSATPMRLSALNRWRAHSASLDASGSGAARTGPSDWNSSMLRGPFIGQLSSFMMSMTRSRGAHFVEQPESLEALQRERLQHIGNAALGDRLG